MNDGKQLRDVLKKKNLLISEEAIELDISRSRMHNLLNKSNFSRIEQLAFTKKYNLPQNFFKADIPLEYGLVHSRRFDQYANLDDRKEQVSKYAKDYYEPIKNYFRSAEKFILIRDYFERNDPELDRRGDLYPLQQEREKYFEELDEIILNRYSQNSNFRYIRILELPLNYFKKEYNRISENHVIESAVQLLYQESFEHIYRLLQKGKEDGVEYIELYVTEQPRKLHSTINVDENILIEETNRYDINMNIIPDSISIHVSHLNSKTDEIKAMISKNRRMIDKMIDSNTLYPIYINDLLGSVRFMIQELKNKELEYSNKLIEIRQIEREQGSIKEKFINRINNEYPELKIRLENHENLNEIRSFLKKEYAKISPIQNQLELKIDFMEKIDREEIEQILDN